MTTMARSLTAMALISSLALSILFAAGASTGEKSGPPRQQTIVTIDLKAILMNSLPGKAVQVRFRDHVTAAKAKVDEKTAVLQKLDEESSSPGFTALSDADRKAKLKAFEKEKLELKFLVEDTEKQLQGTQQAMIAALTQEIKTVVERVAKDKGYDLVLIGSPPGVVFASGLTDATAEVLSAYESEWLKKVPEGSLPK